MRLCCSDSESVTIQVSEKDERVICYIVNTAEYCHETVRMDSHLPLHPMFNLILSFDYHSTDVHDVC